MNKNLSYSLITLSGIYLLISLIGNLAREQLFKSNFQFLFSVNSWFHSTIYAIMLLLGILSIFKKEDNKQLNLGLTILLIMIIIFGTPIVNSGTSLFIMTPIIFPILATLIFGITLTIIGLFKSEKKPINLEPQNN